MKIAIILSIYSKYLSNLYLKHKSLHCEPYSVQHRIIQEDSYGWNGAWANSLSTLGYEVEEFYRDASILQDKWLTEHDNSYKNDILDSILLRQLTRFKPNVVFLDKYEKTIIERIRKEIESIKIIIGWEGSAIHESNDWSAYDAVLSCAPESVEKFKKAGITAYQLHHGFQKTILSKLPPRNQIKHNLSFIGQLLRDSDFHLQRESLLIEIINAGIDLDIFSPSAEMIRTSNLKWYARMCAFSLYQRLRKLKVPKRIRSILPFSSIGEDVLSCPVRPVNMRLRPYLLPTKFGIEMYRIIQESQICLNIHADSSPRYASNMRLFEITGVGTCMLTDWKENLPELFIPDKEVIIYRSPEECLDKINWLLHNPDKCKQIALAGQRRTLKDHTYEKRARDLDRILKKLITFKFHTVKR